MFPGGQNKWHRECTKEKQKALWTPENIMKSFSHVLLMHLEPSVLSNCGGRETRSFWDHTVSRGKSWEAPPPCFLSHPQAPTPPQAHPWRTHWVILKMTQCTWGQFSRHVINFTTTLTWFLATNLEITEHYPLQGYQAVCWTCHLPGSLPSHGSLQLQGPMQALISAPSSAPPSPRLATWCVKREEQALSRSSLKSTLKHSVNLGTASLSFNFLVCKNGTKSDLREFETGWSEL